MGVCRAGLFSRLLNRKSYHGQLLQSIACAVFLVRNSLLLQAKALSLSWSARPLHVLQRGYGQQDCWKIERRYSCLSIGGCHMLSQELLDNSYLISWCQMTPFNVSMLALRPPPCKRWSCRICNVSGSYLHLCLWLKGCMQWRICILHIRKS